MQDSSKKSAGISSRRGLLFGAAAAGAATVAVTSLPRVQSVQAVVAEPKPMPEKGGGYTLSEHVKHYYRTAQV